MTVHHLSRPNSAPASLFLVLLVALSACAQPSPPVPPGSLAVDLEKPGQDVLLTYWLNVYLDPPRDPLSANVLYHSDGMYYLAPEDSIRSKAPGLLPLLTHEFVDWDIFSTFIQDTWHDAAGHPRSIGEWIERVGNWREAEGWLRIPVKGSMSPYERVVSVQESAVRHALSERSRGGALIYPEGTLFVADHMVENQIMETTIMWKRQSDTWDYVSYDGDGHLTDRIFKEPDPLQSPIQCLGCHRGNRAFEPERSFPAPADPGPNGARYIDVDNDARDAVVTSVMNEHMRRSDTILGLYATIFLSRVRVRVLSGRGSASDSLLLMEQGIPVDADAS